MNKLISVILPVYNVEKYIEKCIQSILNQTYTNFELLIINDGTKDNSIKIVKTFNDPRIKKFKKKNGGISDARNFGLQKAKGEFIYFIDSDDWIEPNLLETCIIAIKKHKSELIVFGYKLDREDAVGNLISSNIINHSNMIYDKTQNNIFITNIILSSLGFVWNKFYSASFLKKNQLKFNKNITVFEDVIFNSKIFELVDRIIFINDVLYHYIDRPTLSLSKTFNPNLSKISSIKDKSITEFLMNWKFKREDINNILSFLSYKEIRYHINSIFQYKNNLNIIEKLSLIQKIINQKRIKKQIKYYKPKTLKDKIYIFLIKNNYYLLIYMINKILK